MPASWCDLHGLSKVGWAKLKPPSSAALRRPIRAGAWRATNAPVEHWAWPDGAVSNLGGTLEKPFAISGIG